MARCRVRGEGRGVREANVVHEVHVKSAVLLQIKESTLFDIELEFVWCYGSNDTEGNENCVLLSIGQFSSQS